MKKLNALAQKGQINENASIRDSHSTIINADNIAVIDQGRVVATGTHNELLTTSPLYARLASLQFDQESS